MDVNGIINSIDIIAEKIFKSIEGEVFEKLDELLIIDENILTLEPLNILFVKSSTKGFMLLTTSFIIFYMIYYGINRVISMYNGQISETNIKSIFRLIICTIFSLSSVYICEQILSINGIFTNIVSEIGNDLINEQISFANLRDVVIDMDKYMGKDTLSIDGIIKGIVSFGATTILISFAVRYVTIIVLIFLSPICIMLAANDITYGIFKAWCKTFIFNLLLQNIVVVILAIPLAIKNTNTNMFKIILVGSIYLLYKVNTFSKEILGTISEKITRRN